MKTELLGPYAEAREWLLNYLKTARFENATLVGVLGADWRGYHREHAAYMLGAVWGRLRQTDNALEESTEYMQLVQAEFTEGTE